jgi:hypothetical protein
MTSDHFFATQPEPFDIVFIDGLHLEEQVDKDVFNSMAWLNPAGCIVLHDCNPLTEHMQRDDGSDGKAWNGTVWKSYVKLRSNPALSMYVVDTDHGVGVIQRGQQTSFQLAPLSYASLDANREEALNLISVSRFKELMA